MTSAPHLKASDYIAAAVPLGAGEAADAIARMTLSDWEILARLVGTLLGAAYLLWRWRRDAKRRETNDTFPERKPEPRWRRRK